MAVSIVVDFDKSVEGPAMYKVAASASSATNIDKNVFVLSYPGMAFQQIATPYQLINYIVYDPNNKPPALTKYVRVDTIIIIFKDPASAGGGIASIKSDLKILCSDWNAYNANFVGGEQFTASVP